MSVHLLTHSPSAPRKRCWPGEGAGAGALIASSVLGSGRWDGRISQKNCGIPCFIATLAIVVNASAWAVELTPVQPHSCKMSRFPAVAVVSVLAPPLLLLLLLLLLPSLAAAAAALAIADL